MSKARKIYVVEVNLVEGLFLDSHLRPVGAYNKHKKTLISKHPNTMSNDIIPFLSPAWENEFTGFVLLDRRTDSFSLAAWNPKVQAHTPLHEFIYE
jgi:hypothetical protein